MIIKIEFDAKDAIGDMSAWKGEISKAVSAALYQEANSIMNMSKEIVPVDTGVLKASGFVESPVDGDDKIEVGLGYGGAASAYAEIVHEDLSMKHKPGKVAKYLERPIMDRLPSLAKNVIERVNKAMSK